MAAAVVLAGNLKTLPRGSWSKIGLGGISRASHRAAALSNTLYLYGGDFNATTRASGFYAYDTIGKTFLSRASHTNMARRASSIVEINGKLYTHGGFSAASAIFNDTWEYTPTTNSWVQKANAAIPKNGHAACGYDGHMYIVGGYGTLNSVNQRLKTLYRFTPATNSWVRLTDMPVELNAHITEAIDGKIYVFGGSTNTAVSNALYCYDIATDTWSTLASGPAARNNLVAGIYNGNLYIQGGADASGVRIKDTWVYVPLTNKWTALADGLKDVSAAAGTFVAGKFYTHGGQDQALTYLGDMTVFDPTVSS